MQGLGDLACCLLATTCLCYQSFHYVVGRDMKTKFGTTSMHVFLLRLLGYFDSGITWNCWDWKQKFFDATTEYSRYWKWSHQLANTGAALYFHANRHSINENPPSIYGVGTQRTTYRMTIWSKWFCTSKTVPLMSTETRHWKYFQGLCSTSIRLRQWSHIPPTLAIKKILPANMLWPKRNIRLVLLVCLQHLKLKREGPVMVICDVVVPTSWIERCLCSRRPREGSSYFLRRLKWSINYEVFSAPKYVPVVFISWH